MIRQYEKARSLRLRGYSYNEIQKLLGIPKSTQSGWFKKLVLSKEAKERILSRVSQGVLNGLVKRNKAQTHIAKERSKQILNNAKRDIKNLSTRDLFNISLALYWAEGYKRVIKLNGREVTHHPISFTNSDPKMISLFVIFLKKFMDIKDDKIRLSLRLFDRSCEQKVKKYWLQVTKLSYKNFDKVSYVLSKSSQRKRPFNRLPYGTMQVRVGDTLKFYKLMGWMEGLQEGLAHLKEKH
jgi:hypothetical protein